MDRRTAAAAMAFGGRAAEPDEPVMDEQQVRKIVREEINAALDRMKSDG